VLGRRDPSTADSLFLFANTTRLKGEYTQAEPLFREALPIRRMKLGDDSLPVAENPSLLGPSWSLTTERRVLGDSHPDLGYPLNLLGVVALEEGEWRKAEPLLRESLRMWSTLRPNHTLVTGLTNRGRVLAAKGQYTEARQYFERALTLVLADKQPDHYYTARVLARFALSELDAGDYPAAKELARRAVTIQRSIGGGETAPNTALTMVTLAEARLSG
jgi:tetratricopeptide (TPR) repeat protein